MSLKTALSTSANSELESAKVICVASFTTLFSVVDAKVVFAKNTANTKDKMKTNLFMINKI